jgi:F0F1-type ATP synthase membrane subunit c/vacuolar-type H+-ATPase subunit K
MSKLGSGSPEEKPYRPRRRKLTRDEQVGLLAVVIVAETSALLGVLVGIIFG